MASVKVILRQWKRDASTIALFPELPADPDGEYCMAYDEVGQYGPADYVRVIAATTPLKDQRLVVEALSLLEKAGYENLKIYQKVSAKMNSQRIVNSKGTHPDDQ